MTTLHDLTSGALQLRAATVEEVDVTTREMLVRVVPYDQETDIGGGILETFVRGAFASAEAHRLSVWHDHGGPLVGRGTAVDDREDGSWVRARIGSTQAARDMLTLVEEKILTDVSAEFLPIRTGMTIKELPGGRYSVRHKKAHLKGFAVVPEGAYGNTAYVASVRDAEREREREKALAWLLSYSQQNPFHLAR